MFIDTHSHLNLEQFSDDYSDVIHRMEKLQVRTNTVGTEYITSQRALELAHQFPEITRALVGLHPAYVDPSVDYSKDIEHISELALDTLCVGIGECGFDFFREPRDRVFESQKQVFIKQIELSEATSKPLMLHLRPTKNTYDAYDDALILLQEYKGKVVGQAHFFAGTAHHAQQFLDLGFYISCTGVITFTDDYNEIIKMVPLDRLLLETDAPYVAPTPFRGSRCEPVHVIEVYQKVAELRDMPIDELQRAMKANVERLYRW